MNILYLRDQTRRDTITYKISVYEEKMDDASSLLVATIETYE